LIPNMEVTLKNGISWMKHETIPSKTALRWVSKTDFPWNAWKVTVVMKQRRKGTRQRFANPSPMPLSFQSGLFKS